MSTRREGFAEVAPLGTGSDAPGAGVAARGAADQASLGTGSRNFVLVHGAWHGGWCYRRVADLLRAQGHYVATPTLTGLGERSHLTQFPVNCSTHIQDVVNVIRWERLDDVILCGHSYGGVVIGAVADAIPHAVSALVYLDCPLPENGKTVFDLTPEWQASAVAAAAEYGGFSVKPPTAQAMDVNVDDQDLVDALLTPHPLASLCEPLKLSGAYLDIPRKIYVEATRGSYPAPERIRADDGWEVTEIPSGHDLMIDAPEAVTEILLSATVPQKGAGDIR